MPVRLCLSVMLIFTNLSYCDNSLQKCDKALTACRELVLAQDEQAEHLKEQVKQLQGELVEATKPNVIPTWMWVTLGVAAGVFLGHTFIK